MERSMSAADRMKNFCHNAPKELSKEVVDLLWSGASWGYEALD
jgi:hypothetical protein